MSQVVGPEDNGKNLVSLEDLPKSVVQGIYNAVTGKTETLSDVLKKNVIISDDDICRLHSMIVTQINLHELIAQPTVTIVVRQDDGRSLTYSSWARFRELSVGNYELTSEFLYKIEFLIQIPNTPRPQRCIVNINLDSSLPLVLKRDEHVTDADPLDFSFFISREWRTVFISIDFVDFLIAKSFSGVVKEWFDTLTVICPAKSELWIRSNQAMISRVMQQTGRVGMAFFVLAFTFFSRSSETNVTRLAIAACIGLILWSISSVAERVVFRNIVKRVVSNIFPSVILLSEIDRRQFDDLKQKSSTSSGTLARFVGSVVVALSLNVLASYIYAYMTSPK